MNPSWPVLILTTFGGMQWFSTWSTRSRQLGRALVEIEVELLDKPVVIGIRGAAVFDGRTSRRWKNEQPGSRARYVKVDVKGRIEAFQGVHMAAMCCAVLCCCPALVH